MIGASPLPLAIGASLALHGAAIAALETLPGALHVAHEQASRADPALLRASLRAPVVVATAPAPQRESRAQAAARDEPVFGMGPVYYPAHVLDERPQVRTHIEPRFPESAEVAAGRVVLHLYINEDGAVDEVAILESEPPGAFDAAVAEAFGPARFRPGRKAGVPVKSRMAIEVVFGAPINGGQHE